MIDSKAKGWGTTGAAFIGGAVILASATAFLVSHQVTATAEASSVPTTKVAAGMFPGFATPQTQTDVMPAFLVEGDQALDTLSFGTVRSLGSTPDGVRLWTGFANNGEVCLVALLPGADEFASMTCVTPARFATGNLALQAGSKTSAVRAYFLPSDAAISDTANKLSSQLVLGDPHVTSTKKTSSTIAKVGATALDLPTFEAVELGSK